jgi:hypothetical protein
MLMRSRTVYSLAELLESHEVPLTELMAASGVEPRVARAILEERYTPSPEHRQRIAAVLGTEASLIRWGHRASCEEHLYGPV